MVDNYHDSLIITQNIDGIYDCMKWYLLLFFLFTTHCRGTLFSEDITEKKIVSCAIGPEIYSVHRTKKQGAKQEGTLYGFRATVEHWLPSKYYWGVDFLWAKGELKGHSEEVVLKSTMIDQNLEVRFGYTFACRIFPSVLFTPFAGVGSFCEQNNYKNPSPLKVHFKNAFGYVPLGFLFRYFFNPSLSLGCNFKARYLFQSSNKVSKDPDYGVLLQHYKENWQYRLELPCSYSFLFGCRPCSLIISPFYEYRSYGYQVNFPFDFIETKFNLYGLNIKLLSTF